jgi:hypothetical protein
MVIKVHGKYFFKMLEPGGFTMSQTPEAAQQFDRREDAERTVDLILLEAPGVACEIIT